MRDFPIPLRSISLAARGGINFSSLATCLWKLVGDEGLEPPTSSV